MDFNQFQEYLSGGWSREYIDHVSDGEATELPGTEQTFWVRSCLLPPADSSTIRWSLNLGVYALFATPQNASMSRPLRIEFPGALYHVTSRGDRREPLIKYWSLLASMSTFGPRTCGNKFFWATVCVRPSHLDVKRAGAQAWDCQRYGSSAANVEAGCVGKRSSTSLR